VLVIVESWPWREQLLRSADALERRKTQRRWTERTGFLVERDIMVGCYAIRKLQEARKISDELAAQIWEVTLHPLTASRPPDIWGRSEPWEYYNLQSGHLRPLITERLCNQVIHSYIWMISATEQNVFNGIYVASDRQRARGLYFIHVDRFIELFRAVGLEDIFHIEMRRDKNGDLQYVHISSRYDDSD
jgi:hypothetical protein